MNPDPIHLRAVPPAVAPSSRPLLLRPVARLLYPLAVFLGCLGGLPLIVVTGTVTDSRLGVLWYRFWSRLADLFFRATGR